MSTATQDSQRPRATFYFDLGSPYAYLTAERLELTLGDGVDWQPLSLGALFKLVGRSSWALAGARSRADGLAEVERRAERYGLPPLRWPQPWPGNYLLAMRAATFAREAGREREFATQAFRDAFQLGRDLSEPTNVLASCERAGLDAGEVEAATGAPAIKQALRAATDAAHARGVIGVPTLAVANTLFWGDDRLDEAAAQLLAR
jgi:2-hydroxychromene-2-carboxylate isomerase